MDLRGKIIKGLLKNKKNMKFKNQKEFIKYAEDNELYYEEEIFDKDIDYEEYEIINPEGSQKLIHALIDKKDIDYEEARKQLTVTDQYCDWKNTIADRILNAIEEGEEIDEDMIKEYNEAVADFNKYGEAEYIDKKQTVEEIEDIIHKNDLYEV